MDANKLIKLREVGYVVRKTCGNCVFSKLNPSTGWGTCALHAYEHQKHSEAQRQMSIVASGRCTSWENRGG